VSADPAVVRAAAASAEARPEFGAFFQARFLGLDISYDDEARAVAFAAGSWRRLEQKDPTLST